MRMELPSLDALLAAHAAQLGADHAAYRGHAYRVLNLYLAQEASSPLQLEKLAVTVAFHDLGIWTDRSFDYLEPSVRLAGAHLASIGRVEWLPEIRETILGHHKLSRHQGPPGTLIEPFRRADWVDVTCGIVSFGLPRRFLRELFTAWPSQGFHRRLAQLGLARLRTHPFNPLPMLRL